MSAAYVDDLRDLAADIARVADLPPVEQVRALANLLNRVPDSAHSRLYVARLAAVHAALDDLGGGRGSQHRLAKDLGVSEAAVSHLVRGRRRYRLPH